MNNAVTNMRKHTDELEAVEKKGNELRTALRKAIADLPENPAVKRVERNPRCFTLSSLAVFGDPKGNPTMRMDVFYHDFKAQYEVIAKAVDSCQQANVLKALTAIAEEGTLKKTGNNYYRFHPSVVNHIRTLIGMPADFTAGRKTTEG
jgi:hypothetical protein